MNQKIMNEIIPIVEKYYNQLDLAHNMENHINEVVEWSRVIANRYSHKNINNCIVAAYLHDIFKDKKNHEKVIYNALTSPEGELREWFNEFCKRYSLKNFLIAKACLEHKTDFKGEFSSIISEILSTANNVPDIKSITKRSIFIKLDEFSNDSFGREELINTIYDHSSENHSYKSKVRKSFINAVYDYIKRNYGYESKVRRNSIFWNEFRHKNFEVKDFIKEEETCNFFIKRVLEKMKPEVI
jgi:DNA-binding phage protein